VPRWILVNSATPSPPEDPQADGDRISITEVNGTVAQFEMTYSPPVGARAKFGPPWRTRLPSAAYLLGAFVLGTLVLYAYLAAPSSSALFVWVVEGDRGRPLSAGVLAVAILVSAVATVVRTHMRGVLVSDQWIEARYLLPFGIPRARRWAWAQVHRVIIDRTRLGIELWDSSFERLPEVEKPHELTDLILQQARMRRIGITVLDSTPT